MNGFTIGSASGLWCLLELISIDTSLSSVSLILKRRRSSKINCRVFLITNQMEWSSSLDPSQSHPRMRSRPSHWAPMNNRAAMSQLRVHRGWTFRTQQVSWTLVSPALWTQLKLQESKRATIKCNSTIQPFWRSSAREILRTCMQCLTLHLSSTENTTLAWVYWVQRRADTRNPSFANHTSSKLCNRSLSL